MTSRKKMVVGLTCLAVMIMVVLAGMFAAMDQKRVYDSAAFSLSVGFMLYYFTSRLLYLLDRG